VTLLAAEPLDLLIVLGACYSELNAQALLRHVDCVVGMSGAIAHDAARSSPVPIWRSRSRRVAKPWVAARWMMIALACRATVQARRRPP
jgi:hypothetical protein